MRLREILLGESNNSTVCKYLDANGIKYKKTKTSGGATFDLIKSTPKQTKNILDDILNVTEITKNFDIGYAGGTTIVVEF